MGAATTADTANAPRSNPVYRYAWRRINAQWCDASRASGFNLEGRAACRRGQYDRGSCLGSGGRPKQRSFTNYAVDQSQDRHRLHAGGRCSRHNWWSGHAANAGDEVDGEPAGENAGSDVEYKAASKSAGSEGGQAGQGRDAPAEGKDVRLRVLILQ